MAELEIREFKGIAMHQTKWSEGFAYQVQAIDIWGLGDDASRISIPGQLQRAMGLSAMSGSAFVSSIGGITRYNNDNFVYAIDVANTGNIFRYNTATATWIDVSAINVSGAGRNLLNYNNSLFYLTSTYIGQYDGTNGNANWNAVSGTGNPGPTIVYNGSAFFGCGRYIAKYDGTTFSATKLTLPADFSVRSFAIFRDYLFFTADNGSESFLYRWDGVSPTYNDAYPLKEERSAPTLCAAGGMLWLVGNRGGSQGTTMFTGRTPIYVSQDGEAPSLLYNIPIKRDNSSFLSGVTPYFGGLLVASSEGSSATFGDGVGGLWYIGKDVETGQWHTGQLFLLNTGLQQTINAVFFSGIDPVGGARPALFVNIKPTGGSETMYQVAGTYDEGTATWTSLPIDAGSNYNKMWLGFKIHTDTLTTNQSLVIKYKLDNQSSFTSLKTFLSTDPSDDRKAFIPLGKTSRTIQVQILTSSSAGSYAPIPKGLTISYKPCKD